MSTTEASVRYTIWLFQQVSGSALEWHSQTPKLSMSLGNLLQGPGNHFEAVADESQATMVVNACNQSITQRAACALLTLPLPANAQHPFAMHPPTHAPTHVDKAVSGPEMTAPIALLGDTSGCEMLRAS
mmetsp:Transcript_76637/g.194457  ORF Transcript_76637/g.194457 Transcript_76637/m.194457 type:complete len:129 (+) Transcript_76637:1272-1658(+)